jgi:hypothetical protein
MSGKKDVKQLVNEAFKTVDEIRCRLFDHQQFTNGEISFFLRKFQDKRPESFDAIDSLQEVSKSLFESCKSLEEAIIFLQTHKTEEIGHSSEFAVFQET